MGNSGATVGRGGGLRGHASSSVLLLVAAVLMSLVNNGEAAVATKLFVTRAVQKVDTVCLGMASIVKDNGQPKPKTAWNRTAKVGDKSITIDRADVLLIGNKGDIDDNTTNCVSTFVKKLYAPGFDSFFDLTDTNTPPQVLYASWRVQMLTSVLNMSAPVEVNFTNLSPRSVYMKGPNQKVPGTKDATASATSFTTMQQSLTTTSTDSASLALTSSLASKVSALAANFTSATFSTFDMITSYLYSPDILNRSLYPENSTYGAMLVMPDYESGDETNGLYWTTSYLDFQPVGADQFRFQMFEASYYDSQSSPPPPLAPAARRLRASPPPLRTYYYYYSTGVTGDTTTSTGCKRGFCQLKINAPTNCSPYPRCRYTCTCTQGA